MKMRFYAGILTVALVMTANGGICKEDKGRESLVLQGGKYGNVPFPHGKHQGIYVDCKPCHDLFARESEIIDKMKEEGKLKKRAVMTVCKDCHKDLAAKGLKAGPTKCKDCHKK